MKQSYCPFRFYPLPTIWNRCTTLFFLYLLLYLNVAAHGQDLFVVSFGNNDIKRYNSATGQFLGNFTIGGGATGPHDILFGPDGNLYLASGISNEVKRYNGKTVSLSTTS